MLVHRCSKMDTWREKIFPDVDICTGVRTFYGNGEIQGVIGDKEEVKRIRNQASMKESQEKRYIIQKERKSEYDKKRYITQNKCAKRKEYRKKRYMLEEKNSNE